MNAQDSPATAEVPDTPATPPSEAARELHQPAWRGHATTHANLVLEGGATVSYTHLNPTYRDVCNWNTGHAEAVSVTYDRDVLPTSVLLDAFFAAIDSTARNRQGNDVGTQYRTGVYYADERDKPCVEAAMAREQARQDRPVATEAEPLDGFYPAEDYHQDYLDKHPNGYCHIDPSAAESFAQRAGLRRQGAKPVV